MVSYIHFFIQDQMLRNNFISRWIQNNRALRDAIFASLIVLAVAILTGVVVYHSASSGLKKEVQENLLSFAESASLLLDTDAHRAVTKPEDKGSAIYEQARAPFYRLLNANKNLAFIYTAIQKDGKIYFILDSSIPKPGEAEDTSGVMEEYTDATDTMKEAFATQKPLVEEEAYTDDWGTFLSAYAPIFDKEQNFIGIVGTDIRLESYLQRLMSIKKSLAIGLCIAFLASIVVGIGVWYIRKESIRAEKQNLAQQQEIVIIEQQRIADQEKQKLAADKVRRDDMQMMANEFESSVNAFVSQIIGSSAKMKNDAEGATLMTEDMKLSLSNLSQMAKDTAATSERVSHAADQLISSIKEISSQAQQSSQIAQQADTRAQTVRENIQALSDKSNQVEHVLGLITDIAKQINLLSLNATIEAARAGEAGKGFAVVANEVKNLASQVDQSAKEIGTNIEEMREATNISVQSVSEVLEIINRVSNSAETITAAIEEQYAATSHISSNINEASLATKDMSDTIGNVQDASNKTGETAKNTLDAAGQLNNQIVQLNQSMEQFIRKIRQS